MKQCPKCGSEVQDNCTFCPQCGETLSPALIAARKARQKQILTIGGIAAAIIAVAIIVGCIISSRHHTIVMPETATVPDTVKPYPIPKKPAPQKPVSIYGTHTLRGSIGGAGMVLEIDASSDGSVNGTAYYTKYGPSNSLYSYGNISHSGRIYLNEENEYGTWAGEYEGKFDGRTFNGRYTNGKGHTYKFTLQAD